MARCCFLELCSWLFLFYLFTKKPNVVLFDFNLSPPTPVLHHSLYFPYQSLLVFLLPVSVQEPPPPPSQNMSGSCNHRESRLEGVVVGFCHIYSCLCWPFSLSSWVFSWFQVAQVYSKKINEGKTQWNIKNKLNFYYPATAEKSRWKENAKYFNSTFSTMLSHVKKFSYFFQKVFNDMAGAWA